MNRIDHMIVLIRPIEEFLNKTKLLGEYPESGFGVLIPCIGGTDTLEKYLRKIHLHVFSKGKNKNLPPILSFEQFLQCYEVEVCYEVFVSNDMFNTKKMVQ